MKNTYNLYYLKIYYTYFLHIFILCVREYCAMWRSEDNLQMSILSHHVGLRDQTRVINLVAGTLSGKSFCQPLILILRDYGC